MAKKMTKAEMEAFKKKNFDKSKKVTEAQLNKLRKEGSPDKAIAKYKNDPAMREALNRFYGKARVAKTAGSASSSSTSSQRGGPGAKMPKRPAGGPGAKMTARDGRGAKSGSKTSTGARSDGSGSKKSGSAIDAVRNSPEFKNWKKGLGAGTATVATVFGPGKVKAVAGIKSATAKLAVKQNAARNVANRATAKAEEAIRLQKAATAAKNAAKTGKGSGAGSAARAAKLQREAAAAKKAADALAQQARSANARAKTLGTPKNSAKTGPKSKTASPKAPVSGTAKQADDMLMNMKGLAKKKSVRRTAYVAGGAAYLSRTPKDKK
jgi:hypothetical protein